MSDITDLSLGEEIFGQKDLNYRLSKRYCLKDLTSCRAAIKNRFDNWPWQADTQTLQDLLLNMADMAQNLLQPLFEIDGTIQILGAWRSPDLFLSKNALFESFNPNPDFELAHTQGRAVDFFVPGQVMPETVRMVRYFNIPFDTLLIGEQEPTLAGRSWVHITHKTVTGQQRLRVLQMQPNGAMTPLE